MLRHTQVPSMDDGYSPEDLESPETLEVGTLAISSQIKINENITKSDFWQRPTNIITPAPPLPEDGSSVLRFDIRQARLLPHESTSNKAKRYVVYDLTVGQDSLAGKDAQPIVIERRYTDFRTLFLRLRSEHPQQFSKLNIDFPNKVLMGNFSSDLIAQRSVAFEDLLYQIASNTNLRDSLVFLQFLQEQELTRACQLLDERRNENAIPLLENCFLLLNKIYMDRSRPVILMLCRLVAACTSSPVPHQAADRWANLALGRYETLCDIDLLPLYIPLLHTCAHLWWQRGLDQKHINDRLTAMKKRGININDGPTLMQAIHKLDPRTETM